MCVQWTRVLYSVVITWQSNPPISQFNSPCNEFTSIYVCIQYPKQTALLILCPQILKYSQQVNGFEHKLDRYYLHYKSDQLPMFHSSHVCCLIRFLLLSNTTDLNTTTSKLYNNLFTSYYYICISGMINKCHV